MNAYAVGLVGSFLLPPKIFLVPALVAWLLLDKWPRAARRVLGGALVLLWVFSMPAVGDALLDCLDRSAGTSIPAPMDDAQAIVVLSGGRHYDALDFGGDTVDEESLERVRAAALLYRKHTMPVLVAGGRPEKNVLSLSELMRRALSEYAIPVTWMEEQSKNTAQNAENSAAILRPLGIRRIVLVTHGTHMPRARAAFERAGFHVIPRAVGLHHATRVRLVTLLPTSEGMRKCEMFFHEMLGIAWYAATNAGRLA